jgi:hypothetical protein
VNNRRIASEQKSGFGVEEVAKRNIRLSCALHVGFLE